MTTTETRMGLLEAMARADLDVLLEEIGCHYRSGAFEAMTAADPEWRAALDRAEAEVGGLFQTLCEADAALAEWHRAMATLSRLWREVHDPPAAAPAPEPGLLEEVA